MKRIKNIVIYDSAVADRHNNASGNDIRGPDKDGGSAGEFQNVLEIEIAKLTQKNS